MNTELTAFLKEYLLKNSLDGIIINSTNEFLVEYNSLEQNSRYHLTGFTGSTGDVLFTSDKIYLFVDGRYHEQASLQVDEKSVEVVKLSLGRTFSEALFDKISPYFKLGIIASKTSKNFYDSLLTALQTVNSQVKILNHDPVSDFINNSQKFCYNVFSVPAEIAGLTPDEKFDLVKDCAGEDKFNILITSLEDIAYLTNLRSFDFPYSAVFPAKAIINESGVSVFSDCKLPFIGDKFQVFPFSGFESAVKNIKNTRLYADKSKLSLQDFNLINSNNEILQSHFKLLKTVKHDNEIDHLKSCFEKSDKALGIITQMLNSDNLYSEYDYYEAIINSLKENGASALSFKPIVASGSNSSIVHYGEPSKEKIVEDGDFLLIDYGAYYEGGYSTDTTRTFIKGEPSQEQKKVYTSVMKAFLNAYYNDYGKKSSYFDIDKITRETINKSLPREYAFSHSTGHGVGICVHENPPVVSFSAASGTKILENSVFSVEPGVYKENWGGVRLENTVYAVQEENKIKLRSFSSLPFEIKLVDLSLLNDYEKYYYMKWQEDTCHS